MFNGIWTELTESGQRVVFELESSSRDLSRIPIRWLSDEEKARKLLSSVRIPLAPDPD
jgi:hypothetical protein